MNLLIISSLLLAFASALDIAVPKKIKLRNIMLPVGKASGRITRGNFAANGQFPYQVGLVKKDYNGNSYKCGGSLISNTVVLTAAHCVTNAIKVRVFLGTIDLQSPEVHYVVAPKDIKIHKKYDKDIAENDIALIKIPYTKYTKTIQAVKLPAKDSVSKGYEGETAVASGFGRIFERQSDNDFLKYAQMEVISNRVCTRELVGVTDNVICTSTFGGVSTCHGDSGGPLVLEVSKTLIGIATAVSVDGCEKEKPALFNRVASYLDWIEENSKSWQPDLTTNDIWSRNRKPKTLPPAVTTERQFNDIWSRNHNPKPVLPDLRTERKDDDFWPSFFNFRSFLPDWSSERRSLLSDSRSKPRSRLLDFKTERNFNDIYSRNNNNRIIPYSNRFSADSPGSYAR